MAFALYSIVASSTITTITNSNSGLAFSPASVTINIGDSVNFVLTSIHTVVEVSQATWNANGTTPLSNGFSKGSGGGMVLPAKLTLGTHYYVCGNHASFGMKGVIIVQDPSTQYTVSVSANPSSGGNVSGGNTYNAGLPVTVNATANAGYTFTNWTDSTGIVSSSSSYVFTASGNRTLTANFSPVTGIYNLQVDKNNISIYPNPTSGNFTLVVSDFKNEEMQVRIINAAGEEIYLLPKEKINGAYSKDISLQNISKGIYFVQIKTREGMAIRKIVINN